MAGIKLSQVNGSGKDKPLTINFGEQSLELTYDRSTYTPLLEEEMNRDIMQNRPGAALSRMLARVLRSWNLNYDEGQTVEVDTKSAKDLKAGEVMPRKQQDVSGQPIPLTEENLHALLSIDVQGRIVQALGEDQRPKLPPSEPSEDF